MELSQNIVVWGNEFKEELKKHEDLLKKDIYDEYSNWYLNGEHQINYLTKVVLKKESHEESFNNELNNDLMKLKEERWVTPDKGILAQIFNPNEPEQEPVLQTTWQMNEWREQAEKFVYPILISMINNSEKRVMEYASELAEDYQVKLTEMLELEIKEKNDLIDLLSNEEKQLEIDYIWLSDFKSQLTKIEKE